MSTAINPLASLQAPAEVASAEPPQDFGANNQNLPPEYIAQLRMLARKFSQRDSWARLQEVRLATEQRFFYRGKQHIWWNDDLGSFQVGPSGSSAPAVQKRSRKTFNIYLSYAKSFIAVFAANQAGVRFEPEDPGDHSDIQAAAEAEKMRRLIEKFNNPKQLQIDLARLLWTDGRVIAHTRWVTDAERFGTDPATGQARGQECIDLYGVLEAKVPLTARERYQWPYCKISGEFDIALLKAQYPNAAKSLGTSGRSGSPDDQLARNARIGTAEGTRGVSEDSLAHLGTLDRFWFRPAAFTECSEDWQQKLKALFPHGCYAAFVGETYCESRDEALDDHLAVLHATPGDGQDRPSAGMSTVDAQKEFNDGMNLASELFKQTTPAKWVDEKAIDIDAIQEQEALPGSYYPAERANGEALGDHFFTEPTIEFPASAVEWLENLQGPLAQFLNGQQPALFGAQMEDQKTASGYAQARNQAMGLLAIVWLPFKRFYAEVMLQAVKAARDNRPNDKPAATLLEGNQGTQETVSVNIEALDGNLLAFPDSDENFPETHTAKAAMYMQLLTIAQNNPQMAEILNHPKNLALGKDCIGLEDFEVPGADSEEKQLEEIAEMLQVAPVPSVEATLEQAQQTGQIPAEPVNQSSVPIDLAVDDHAREAQTCKDWLNSVDGRKAKRENPDGYQNIRLHMLEHLQAVAQMAAPMLAGPAPAANPQADQPQQQ